MTSLETQSKLFVRSSLLQKRYLVVNRSVSLCVMIVAIGAWITISFAAPWVLSDAKNTFLKNFVNHEMLSFLGLIVTITLASSASLHLALNNLEERAGSKVFVRTRARIHRSAYALLVALVIALALVIAKPLVGDTETATSFINGAAILVVLFNVLVLADITKATFSLEPTVGN